MKWLEWSRIDLEFGLGGVEEHARSLARELRSRGVEVVFSRDEKDLHDERWDVVHTHGNGVGPSGAKHAIRLHTLHGTTLGRMAACGEWFWPRGYLAELQEVRAVFAADAVLSVHPRLSLLRLAEKLGRPTRVCGNAWDSGVGAPGAEAVPAEILGRIDRSRPLWIYVGRGDDRVKGADRVRALFAANPQLQIFAVPGSGFEGVEGIFQTGRISATEVRGLMSVADGILCPSRYEGNSLVVLEALASGMHVLSTRVGLIPDLPLGVAGVHGIPFAETERWRAVFEEVRRSYHDRTAREARVAVNRAKLPRWADVAEAALAVVVEARARKT